MVMKSRLQKHRFFFSNIPFKKSLQPGTGSFRLFEENSNMAKNDQNQGRFNFSANGPVVKKKTQIVTLAHRASVISLASAHFSPDPLTTHNTSRALLTVSLLLANQIFSKKIKRLKYFTGSYLYSLCAADVKHSFASVLNIAKKQRNVSFCCL